MSGSNVYLLYHKFINTSFWGNVFNLQYDNLSDMKAQKIDNIRFTIDQGYPDLNVDIRSRKGELYLSLSNILFKEGATYYEIPINKLQFIKVLNKDPLEIEFTVPSIRIKVLGANAERLLALRHLLLPYLEGKDADVEPLPNIINLWSLGIRKNRAISDLLRIPMENVVTLVEKAKTEMLIDDDGLTEEGICFLAKHSEKLDSWGEQ